MKTEYLIKIGSVAKWLGPFFVAGGLSAERVGFKWAE